MRYSEQQLKKIIKEEIENAMAGQSTSSADYIRAEQRIDPKIKKVLLKLERTRKKDLSDIVKNIKEGFKHKDQGDLRKAKYFFGVAAAIVSEIDGGKYVDGKFQHGKVVNGELVRPYVGPSGLTAEDKMDLSYNLKNHL